MVFKYLGLYLITIEQNSGQIQLILGVYSLCIIASRNIFIAILRGARKRYSVSMCVL
jgi:hypothetical protein